jgi:tRNA (uracil-5-)-methyltransferase TRM9
MESLMQKIEEEHVHKVYNAIAGHFSDTRYKPWPVVEQYLQGQEPYSLGIFFQQRY